MSIKGDWIDEFERLLLADDPNLNKNNEDYAYQLATAYFDWDTVGIPAESVENAFQRYLERYE